MWPIVVFYFEKYIDVEKYVNALKYVLSRYTFKHF